MSVPEAVRDALRDAGCPVNDRTVDEVVKHLPVDVTVPDVVAAHVTWGMTVTDVVAAIRGECRMRAAGQPSNPRRANPTLPDPLPPPPKDPGVAGRGLAEARAALAIGATVASTHRVTPLGGVRLKPGELRAHAPTAGWDPDDLEVHDRRATVPSSIPAHDPPATEEPPL